MKKVLIIGGSYFLGRVFVSALLKQGGVEITVLNRGKFPLNRDGIREIVCDRHDQRQLNSGLALDDWDVVVDCCAYSSADITSMFATGALGKLQQYIFISTSSVYARTNLLPINEDAALLQAQQPSAPGEDYALNKLQAEQTLIDLATRSGSSWTILRPAMIYGVFNYAPRENYFFDLIVSGRPVIVPSNSLSLFSFVSVWDCAKLIRSCVDNQTTFNAAFNLAAGELVSYPLLIDVLREITGIPFPLEQQEVGRILADNLPLPFPFDEHLVYDGSRIAGLLDFRYTPLLDAMRETYRLYRIGRGLD